MFHDLYFKAKFIATAIGVTLLILLTIPWVVLFFIRYASWVLGQ